MQKNHNWIWFFAALVVLGSAAIAINWAYNAKRQLTMDELSRNEDLWEKAGPADYDLVIDKTIQSTAGAEPMRDRIEVKVRNRKPVAATLNGRSMPRRARDNPWDKYDVDGWFGFLEEFLKIDSAPGAPSTYRTAEFDPQTGQLLHFTRSVSSTRERQELTLRLTPRPAD